MLVEDDAAGRASGAPDDHDDGGERSRDAHGCGIMHGPDRRALVTRTGRAEAAEAARAWTLDVASDAGAPR
jgi:hypothetical protein